jgi:hypothetical protein
VDRVGTGLRGEVHDPSIESPELRRWTVALDLELLNGIDDWVERDLAGLRLQHGDAVEQILVRARSAAVDAWQHRIRRQRDPRRDRGERDEEAAVQRQPRDLFVLDHGPEACRGFPRDRRVRDDGHLFVDGSEIEVEVETRLFAGRDPDAQAAHRLEARELDLDPVLPRRQACGRVDAVGGGDDNPPEAGPDLGDRDDRPGEGGALLVPHHSRDFSGRHLGSGTLSGRAAHAHDGEAEREPSLSRLATHPDPSSSRQRGEL